MESNKVKVYLASGWFTPNTREILDNLELILEAHPNVDLYSPRRDGIMLPPNQRHDTALRESIFAENINHILEADLVFANIDSKDTWNDPGTIYEIGYAMANDVPVVGFATSMQNIAERFKGIIGGFECIITDYSDINGFFGVDATEEVVESAKPKVLFVGMGNKELDSKLVSHIIESGFDIRWINETHSEIYPRIDEIFEDVDFMITVIDDRTTLSSWMIGQAYGRQVPIITYSNFNYGINVMLLVSILTHLRGTDELVKFLQQVKRSGLSSIPRFDISQMDSM